jgi:ABC-type glycerol-3-phosphate transport system permease component
LISIGTVVASVSVGTMAAYGLSRLCGAASRGLLFVLLSMRMFPHILLAIPFFVLARTLGLKRLLAYHTVENIGIIFIGLGIAGAGGAGIDCRLDDGQHQHRDRF